MRPGIDCITDLPSHQLDLGLVLSARRASASRSDFFSNSVRSQAHSTNAMQAASDKAMKRFMIFSVPDVMSCPVGSAHISRRQVYSSPPCRANQLAAQPHQPALPRAAARSYFLILSYKVFFGMPN